MQLIRKDRIDDGKKYCKQCGVDLPQAYKDDICPSCLERNLFYEVKDYIRENIVNENDVAEHFNIPLRKVRSWIHEGRIQYKGDTKEVISGVKCRICNKPISYGVFCSECYKLEQLKVVTKLQKPENAEMRFIGQDKN